MMESMDRRSVLERGFWVGSYLAEPQLQRISRGMEDVRVEPKVMDVLVRLAEQPGRTVTKEAFMEEVWADTVVTDDALLRCISELRKIFQDDPREPRYIETIRKKGYRLIASVSPVEAAPQETAPPAPGPVPAPPPEVPVLPAEIAATPAEAPPRDVPRSPDRPRRPRTSGRWVAPGAFMLLVVVLLFVIRQERSGETVVPLQTIPFTSYRGVELDPNISPDGRRIVFVWDQGDAGGFDIYVKQIGEETALRLTNNPANDRSPSWSSDGLHVAFVRSGAEGNGIYIVPALGGAERLVVDLGNREVHGVAWSPTGEVLAYTAQPAPHAPLGIWLFSLETRETRLLTEPPSDYHGDLELAFSPDGRRLAFVRSIVERVDDIYVVPVEGGELKRLTFDYAEVTGLDWTADGQAIVYSSDRAGSFALWRVPVSGGMPRWIATTAEGSGVHQPSVARQSTRLAFMQRLQETNIWHYPLVEDTLYADTTAPGEAPPRAVITSTRWDSNPALSPDGRRLAFASNRSGSYEIWMSNRDGTDPVQLTRFGGPFTNTPSWSPDGERIAFVARDEGSVDVFVVDVAGGRIRQLTAVQSIDRAPSWSHDGSWIYFGSNREGVWNIWKVPATGGDALQVTTNGGIAAQEAPGGEELFYVKSNTAGIWSRPLAGGDERLVVEELEPYDWGNWRVAEEGIYFVRRTPSGPVLVLHRFGTGEREVVVALDRLPRHPGLAILPGGKEVFYTRIDRIEGDILLAEGFQ